ATSSTSSASLLTVSASERTSTITPATRSCSPCTVISRRACTRFCACAPTELYAQLRLERAELFFETLHALLQRFGGCPAALGGRGGRRYTTQHLRPARFFLTGTARKLARQRIGRRGQSLQRFLHFRDGRERVKPIAAATQLARRLRPTQEQQRHDRLRGVIQLKRRFEIVLPPHRPPSDKLPDELLLLQHIERVLHIGFSDFHHRLPIRLLIARRNQRVDGERVVLGCRHLLFRETAEDAKLQR